MTVDHPVNLPDLRDRVALVTGAGRGIGRAVAGDLARAGATVAVVARSADQLADIAREIRAAGGGAAACTADLTSLGAAQELVTRAARELGAIDVLVNNAGTVAPLGPTESLDAAEVEASYQLNILAPMVLSAAVIPAMRARNWGRIVNVSSGIVANPAGMVGANTYAGVKSALEAHSRNLAAELDGTGITVNVYRPGRVDTAMQAWIRSQDPARVGGGLVDRFAAAYQARELITPAESAAALVSRLSSPDTGQIWDVTDVSPHLVERN
jgi:3-oxoacyl-[acyl-carrier protein] reductase